MIVRLVDALRPQTILDPLMYLKPHEFVGVRDLFLSKDPSLEGT